MNKLTPALLNELKEKAEKATPGPYDARCREFSNHARLELWTELGWLDQLPKQYHDPTIEFQEATNPETVLLLVAALEDCRQALEYCANAADINGTGKTKVAKEVLEKYFGEDE